MFGPVGVRDLDLVSTPPAWVARRDGGGTAGPVAVALLFHSVLAEAGDVLVTVDVERHGGAHDLDGAIAWSLRPATGVEVCFQVAIVVAVMRCDIGEHRLAEHGFQGVAAPVLRP